MMKLKIKRFFLSILQVMDCPYTVAEIDQGLADEWIDDFYKRHPDFKS